MSYTPVNWCMSDCLHVWEDGIVLYVLQLGWKCHSEPGFYSHWWLHHWPQSTALSWESESAACQLGWPVTTEGQTSAWKTNYWLAGFTKQGTKFFLSFSMHFMSIFCKIQCYKTILFRDILFKLCILLCFEQCLVSKPAWPNRTELLTIIISTSSSLPSLCKVFTILCSVNFFFKYHYVLWLILHSVLKEEF